MQIPADECPKALRITAPTDAVDDVDSDIAGGATRATLFQAVMQDDVGRLAELLERGAELNVHNSAGCTPIELAIERGKTRALEFLATCGPAYLRAQYASSSHGAAGADAAGADAAAVLVAGPVQLPGQLLKLLELELQAPAGEARRSLERLLSFSRNSFAAAARELKAHAAAGCCAGASAFTPRSPSDTVPRAGPGLGGEMLTNRRRVRCQ